MWLINSLAIPAERIASSCVASIATTVAPSADAVDSQWSPSFEKLSFEINSFTVSNSTSSTTSFPSSKHLTASMCVIFLTAAVMAFIFLPTFFPRTGKFGVKERVTQLCCSSSGTTWKSQALSSERIYFLSGPVRPSTTWVGGLRRIATTDLMGVLRLMFRFSLAFRPCSTIFCRASIASTASALRRDPSYSGSFKKCTESLFPRFTGFELPPPSAASAKDGCNFRRC
mmetsp:Transcript_17003/g.39034  ORF Transcript_17003/g.39034 Transcript_17003/m.39034 type:complete len:228 (-) Transcript_17003:2595-3278(-)